VGIFLSEKLAIGLALGFSLSGIKQNDSIEVITKGYGIGISPFLRYYALKWNKFSVYIQGNIGLDFSHHRYTQYSTNQNKFTDWSFKIYPGLSYDITDKLSLQTSINILGLSYDYNINNEEGFVKYKSSAFSFGAGLDNIISVSAITIGAIYKF
jgi:hypothetical protein